jgi:hypothetical protein
VLRHPFEVANPTAEPWRLKHVTSTCSCTTAKLPAGSVGPGETACLEITHRAPLRDGKVADHVVVEFAGPAGPVFQVTVEGEVRALLAADPSTLVFAHSPPGTRPGRTVLLHNRGSRRVAITRVEAPQWLHAEWRPADGPGADAGPRQAWELVVHADPGKLRSDAGSATLAVHTDSPEVGSAFIPVRLEGPLEPATDHIAFGTVEAGKAGLKRLMVRAASDLGGLTEKDLVVTHDLGDELDVQVQRGESPHLFVLWIRFQPKRPRGPLAGTLEVRTRTGTVGPVRVKVSGSAAGPRGGG